MTIAHATRSFIDTSVHASAPPSSASPVSVTRCQSRHLLPVRERGETRKSVKSNLNFDVAVHSYSLFGVSQSHSIPPPSFLKSSPCLSPFIIL